MVDAAAAWHLLPRPPELVCGTVPQLTQKAADIVGLCFEPAKACVVIGVDEKPSIQTLERAQGWLPRFHSHRR